MDSQSQLSLEQQFELRLFEAQVKSLSLEQAHELLVNLRESMVIQGNTFKDIIKESWGIGEDISKVLEY